MGALAFILLELEATEDWAFGRCLSDLGLGVDSGQVQGGRKEMDL